jgi:integrase
MYREKAVFNQNVRLNVRDNKIGFLVHNHLWRVITPDYCKDESEKIMQQVFVSELIDAVKFELASTGMASGTILNYYYDGFVPIMRFYAEKGEANYSPDLTHLLVLQAQEDYSVERKNYRKFLCIRRVAAMLDEYANTNQIIWRSLTPLRTKSLEEPYSDNLKLYERERLANGCALSTVRGSRPRVRQFLFYLIERRIPNASQISKDDVLSYLPVLGEKYRRIDGALSILRNFLVIMHDNGLIPSDMSPLLQISAAKRSSYYFGFTKDEADRVLSAVDRGTPCGKRDYAILMLAAHTGLRAVDVLGLQYSEINWEKQEIRIVQRKTGKQLILPLGTPVCNAIAEYILNGRPNSDASYIFLRDRAPYRKLESGSACSIVKRNAAKAGITWSADEQKGFHSFRRSIGNWMLEAEIPLSMISEVLGHTAVDSSRPYIKTHHSRLSMCALSLAGIESEREELL